MRLRLLGLLTPILVAGCSALSVLGDASRPMDIYELSTPVVQSVGARRGLELVVEEPSASGALATERIMVRPAPLQAQYLPGVRWADPAPVMLQTLLVRTLTETGAFESVGRRPVGTVGDYAILSELLDFQAEVEDGSDGAAIKISLAFRIVRERDARVVATRAFSTIEQATVDDANAIVAAFDSAAKRLFTEAVPWILSRTR